MSNEPVEKSGTWATNYRSFLVRVWREAEDAPWHVSITDVHSKESHAFATVQAFFLYLHEQIADSAFL